MLIHASMQLPYWAEVLSVATYLINHRPSSSIGHKVPYTCLYRTPPTYEHLQVFGCLCYPNLQASSPHKLAPRSTSCVFLGYPSSHKGYRCLDLDTHHIIISRHVIFDELTFHFACESPVPDNSFDFLLDDSEFCSYPNNPAAPLPATAAPSSPTVDKHVLPLASSSPGGHGPMPPPGCLGAPSPEGGASATAVQTAAVSSVAAI